MLILGAVLGFTIFFALMLLIPLLEDTLSIEYRVDLYTLKKSKRSGIYRSFQTNQLPFEALHKLMLLTCLILQCYLVWTYLGFVYVLPILLVLIIIYRGSFRSLSGILHQKEKQRMANLVSGTIEYTRTWMNRLNLPAIDLMRNRVFFLRSSERGGPNLCPVEIEYILRTIASDSDELGLSALQILDSLETQ